MQLSRGALRYLEMKTSVESISAEALAAAIKWGRKQVKRDVDNRYSLLHDWQLPAALCTFWPLSAPETVETPLIRAHRVADGVIVLTVRAYESTAERNICDGCTMSPDTVRGVLPAAIFHDPWYYADESEGSKDTRRQYEIIADEIGVKRATLRKFGDRLFYSIGRAAGGSFLALHLYYYGIRLGYPLYRLARPFLAIIVAALLSGGCAGCILPGEDGTFLDPPLYAPPDFVQLPTTSPAP